MSETILADGTIIHWSPVPVKPKGSKLLIVGELLVTLGVLVALFAGYEVFVQDEVVAASQTKLAQQFGHEVKKQKFVDPEKAQSLGQIFGRMYVPRFGSDWTRLVAEGTRWHPVLNEIGVGHYTRSALPGTAGNFAVAAHRGGFGGAFKNIHRLQDGDRVYLETNHYWYVYKYLQTKIVDPTDISVLDSVPFELDGSHVGGKYMTMTSCTPIFVNTQRIIVWLELDKVIRTSAGAPAELGLGK
jgi:sortase A